MQTARTALTHSRVAADGIAPGQSHGAQLFFSLLHPFTPWVAVSFLPLLRLLLRYCSV